MDQKALEKEIIQFRDDLKEYQQVMGDVWGEQRRYWCYSGIEKIEDLIKTKEISLREKLVEDFGKLERYLIKMGITMNAVKYQRVFPIFDSALDAQLFNNPIKGEALSMAIQAVIKAVGIVKSFSDKDFGKLERKTPIVFVPHNLGEKNKGIVQMFIDFISKFDVEISLGSETDTVSVSEKIKSKIDDADMVLAVMTKDEQDGKGIWSASKWIIDELAYSLGKNKEIIRLIESGCDTNGRIFGDREYIPFDRENSTEALTKLAEVLNKKINKVS